jgi:hypothetical protein
MKLGPVKTSAGIREMDVTDTVINIDFRQIFTTRPLYSERRMIKGQLKCGYRDEAKTDSIGLCDIYFYTKRYITICKHVFIGVHCSQTACPVVGRACMSLAGGLTALYA